jgi:hypothetical protein
MEEVASSTNLQVRDTFSRLLRYLRPLFHLHETPTPKRTQYEGCGTPPCGVIAPDWLQSPLPELDLSPINGIGASPERLVIAVQKLKPFLPTGYELLAHGDLEITGQLPIDAGGFADVWAGEWNGTLVAIKSYRCYSSSNCLPVYLVSGNTT